MGILRIGIVTGLLVRLSIDIGLGNLEWGTLLLIVVVLVLLE